MANPNELSGTIQTGDSGSWISLCPSLLHPVNVIKRLRSLPKNDV
jgi:hypothetical protein